MTDETFRLDDGLDLVVSHSSLTTTRRVANLVLAGNKMKKLLTHCSRDDAELKLRDDELWSAIMDSLVDETIVKMTANVSAAEKRSQFHRVGSDHLCDLRDMSKKDIVHCSEGLRLQAVTLKGGQSEHKVTFKMSNYMSACLPAADEDKFQTVVLSITNSNLHISCSMKDGRAVLSLEECCEKDLQTISSDGNMDRFLFYKRTTGINVTSFESVKCRRWFISTAYEAENQPVEMCEADAASRVKDFHLD